MHIIPKYIISIFHAPKYSSCGVTVCLESIHLHAQGSGEFFHFIIDRDPFQHVHTEGQEIGILCNTMQGIYSHSQRGKTSYKLQYIHEQEISYYSISSVKMSFKASQHFDEHTSDKQYTIRTFNRNDLRNLLNLFDQSLIESNILSSHGKRRTVETKVLPNESVNCCLFCFLCYGSPKKLRNAAVAHILLSNGSKILKSHQLFLFCFFTKLTLTHTHTHTHQP